ncbi:hypothetical protein K438DRAFT_2021513 [Mycena galopus ATCC 62051]|nr:hypothetical protein K438DRAFT_2021513 [Mycena galopus ATCC 62051]
MSTASVMHDKVQYGPIFEDVYPGIGSRAGFTRFYFLSPPQGPAATDFSIAAHLADIPLDRINITGGDFKRIAAQAVPGLYGLAVASFRRGFLSMTCLHRRGCMPQLPGNSCTSCAGGPAFRFSKRTSDVAQE